MLRGLIATTVFVAGLASAAEAAPVSNANAAELACHRLERLVTLKKIEANFVSRFRGLEVTVLPDGGSAGPSFKVVGSQQVDEGKTAHKVELTLNEKGKALTHAVVVGEDPAQAVAWPDKDPVSLAEAALHYIQDNAGKAEIAPFSAKLSALRVVPDSLSGRAAARVEVLADANSGLLRVYLGLDGSVKKWEVEK